MTTKLEQAARQALEALEQNTYYNFDDDIKALREALAEQAEQEPVTMLDDPIFSVNPEYLEARKEAFLKAASNCDARRWIYLNRLNAMYFMPCENKTEPTDRIIFDCEES